MVLSGGLAAYGLTSTEVNGLFKNATHNSDDIPVSMGYGQVKGYVIPKVGWVDARPPDHQHVHNGKVALLGCPVQQREPMVIPVSEGERLGCWV